MHIIILLKGDEVRTYSADGIRDAHYHYLRRIEKEGWYAETGYLVNEGDALPLSMWLQEEETRQAIAEKRRYEEEEYKTYLELQKKYEQRRSEAEK